MTCIAGAYDASAPPTILEIREAGADRAIVHVVERCAFVRSFGHVRGATVAKIVFLPDDWRLDFTILAHEIAHMNGADECGALKAEYVRAEISTQIRLAKIAEGVQGCVLPR